MIGIRIAIDKVSDEDMFKLKMFNRTVKLSGKQKIYEIGFWEAESLYLDIIKNNQLEVEIITKDPTKCPLNIYGVDIFGKRKEGSTYSQKVNKIKSYCDYLHLTSNDKIDNEVLKELLQSQDMPVLVNWNEKFNNSESLINQIKGKAEKNEK